MKANGVFFFFYSLFKFRQLAELVLNLFFRCEFVHDGARLLIRIEVSRRRVRMCEQ